METTAAVNETQIGDFSSYFRWNEESREYEMNLRINPQTDNDSWIVVPSGVRDIIVDPNRPPSVGKLIYLLADAFMSRNRAYKEKEKVVSETYQILEIIGNRLIEEADVRGWCSQFDEIIDEVNDKLPSGWALPNREKEYEVEVQVQGWASTTYTVTVTARSAEDAQSLVDDDPDAFFDADDVLTEHVRYNTFDTLETEVRDVTEA